MGVKVTPPGLSVPVEVPDDKVPAYLSQGWSRVESKSSETKSRQRRKGADADKK